MTTSCVDWGDFETALVGVRLDRAPFTERALLCHQQKKSYREFAIQLHAWHKAKVYDIMAKSSETDSHYHHLLTHALSQVDWKIIAKNLMADVPEDES